MKKDPRHARLDKMEDAYANVEMEGDDILFEGKKHDFDDFASKLYNYRNDVEDSAYDKATRDMATKYGKDAVNKILKKIGEQTL